MSTINVTWSSTITFETTSSGLRVHLAPEKVVPQFSEPDVSQGTSGYETTTSVLKKLKDAFPATIELAGLRTELKSSLEGAWKGIRAKAHEYCFARPAFNYHGDLILELMVVGAPLQGIAQQNTNGRGCSLGMSGSGTTATA